MAKIVICILVFLFGCQFSWADENDMTSTAINERLKPIGEVYVGKPPQAATQAIPPTTPPVSPATPATTQATPPTAPQATTQPSAPQPAPQQPSTQPASAEAQKATTAPAVAASSNVGEKVYQTYCHVCHAVGAAGAPKLGDASDWKPRISQGIPTLVQHAIQGYKVMPPRGTCTTCSDADIAAAVKYMVSKSQ